MNITCPGCGFCAALNIFTSDVDARHFAQLMGKVPPEISDQVLMYIGLFAPAKHKMTFARGRRVLAELVPLIEARQIERNRRSWPAPVSAWRDALAYMIDSRAKLTLPLKSHGYLLEVLVGMADQVEAQAEAKIERDRRDGVAPVIPVPRRASEETPSERIARMRREQEARDEQAPTATAAAAPVHRIDAAIRKAAEAEIENHRMQRASGDPSCANNAAAIQK